MIRLEDIIQELRAHQPDADLNLVRRAYVFSAAAHRGQTRHSGEPYLIHPLEVSHIVARLQLDSASICAALLHDTVEDTVATIEEIENQFGEDVSFLVAGLTKLEKMNFTSAEEAQAENFRKMLVAMSRDLRVILVKLSDRLHNMQTLKPLREEKRRRIAQETLDIYAPLAHRLGINWIKSDLEDLCFKYLYPEEYQALAVQIDQTRKEREAYILRVLKELEGRLLRNNIEAEVTGRPKHLWSIHKKMVQTGRSLNKLYDILAFRIIVDKMPSCYEALGLVHSLWKPIPGRFKDYIALPKENGYQSLHTAVMGPESERVEIQIRTWEMHHVAQLGVAAHWSYKEGKYGGITPKGTDKRFGWLRALLEWQRTLKDPQVFMEMVKVDLFAADVYVFTPEGDVQAFPQGATPVDFAYSIHTDLGHECTGARVNGVQVSLRYQLKNGESVEILRTPRSKPKADWLKFVKTGRARTKIRSFLRQEDNARSLQIGLEVLEKELKRYGVGINKLRKSGQIDQAAQALKYRNERELLISLGYGKAQLDQLLPQLLPSEKLKKGPQEEEEENPFKRLMRKVMPKSRGGVVVDGLEGIATHFPKCCQPVHGDPIVGFVTRGRGITVHRSSCPHILGCDSARRVDVHWDVGSRQLRSVEIRIHSTDQPGLLANMSQSFHNAGVNITAVSCRTSADKRAINNFTVLVKDLVQLNKVIRLIEQLDGVLSVERLAS